MTRNLFLGVSLASFCVLFAADGPAPQPLGKIFDNQIHGVEGEVVSLAEAMPAELFDFAPTQGEFKGVRTFAQQMKHIATVNYMVSAAALGEKSPVEAGQDENGAPAIKGKEAVVKYLKDSFVYARKAAAGMTAANMLDPMPSPFGSQKTTRIALVSLIASHSFDHYGQAVVYARMNKIVPPASR